jgi:hypothetical protein
VCFGAPLSPVVFMLLSLSFNVRGPSLTLRFGHALDFVLELLRLRSRLCDSGNIAGRRPATVDVFRWRDEGMSRCGSPMSRHPSISARREDISEPLDCVDDGDA